MQTITVYSASSADMMAAAIAGVLRNQGEVAVKTKDAEALGRVFSSVGIVKQCMAGHNVDLVSATIKEGSGVFIIKAEKKQTEHQAF